MNDILSFIENFSLNYEATKEINEYLASKHEIIVNNVRL